MALVNMKDMLEHAYRNRYAVGAFDLVGVEFLEAIMSAAAVSSSRRGYAPSARCPLRPSRRADGPARVRP
ncbi:MAG TPA: class II fructose-bisphosphate aldolase [Gammaproteobacteria bacterium]|nr:class II fructose-bisphosphate aldolase [Gammaproteobacteria bacterium]